MRIALPLALFAAPALAVTAFANEPAQNTSDTTAEATETAEAPEAAPSSSTEEPKVEPAVKEEKRICRRIRTDISSRRKEKVCMTSEEWRVYNQRR